MTHHAVRAADDEWTLLSDTWTESDFCNRKKQNINIYKRMYETTGKQRKVKVVQILNRNLYKKLLF